MWESEYKVQPLEVIWWVTSSIALGLKAGLKLNVEKLMKKKETKHKPSLKDLVKMAGVKPWQGTEIWQGQNDKHGNYNFVRLSVSVTHTNAVEW